MASIEERLRLWAEQSAVLAIMDNEQFGRLVDRSQEDAWGTSSRATLPDGRAVFVKRVPLTEREYERAHSTRNHFRLPVGYQYGVGSAGFGAWRELAVHVKTTGWVVDGSCTGFPMLVHSRVMRRCRAGGHGATGARSWVQSADYQVYWNGSRRIASFIEARRTAPFELWLVLEYVPSQLVDWLLDHVSAADRVIDELVATIRFLHHHGVFHFDAHYGNVVTDDGTPLLTDFGLATDHAFDLSTEERAFLDRHRHYDFGEAIYSISNLLWGSLAPVSREERSTLLRRLQPDAPVDTRSVIGVLVANIERLADHGLVEVPAHYAAVVARYRPVILFMNDFFSSMRSNPRKNTFFDDARLAGLLTDAGVDVS
jgi:hypothetical protein